MGKKYKSQIHNPSLFISPQMQDDIATINHPNRRFRWIDQPLWPYTEKYKDNLRSPTFLSPRDRTNRRKLIEALVAPEASEKLKSLGYQILQCERGSRCNSPLCNCCRTKLQNNYEDRVLKYFGRANHDELYFLTILDEVTYKPLSDMKSRQTKLQETLRNRLKSRKYNKNIAAFGAFEIDVKSPLHSVKNQQQKQLMQTYGMFDTPEPAFMPHMHVIVDLRGMCDVEFRDHLTKRFTKSSQVTLSPFRLNNSLEFNLARTARYCFKFRYQHPNNILRDRSAYRTRFSGDLLRKYTELVHSIKGLNGVISFEFRHNLL